jgi:hypothetical protein
MTVDSLQFRKMLVRFRLESKTKLGLSSSTVLAITERQNTIRQPAGSLVSTASTLEPVWSGIKGCAVAKHKMSLHYKRQLGMMRLTNSRLIATLRSIE